MLEFVKGDIFDAPADIRVNTVNCVGVMGAGVALAFKRRYPDMFKAYQRDCKHGRVRPGTMNVWKSLSGDWIINFPTKRDWREPSRYEDIDAGLDDLRSYLDMVGSVTIALPALGCGHGGLDWNRVSGMIRNKLDGVDAHVLVFEPAASRQAGRTAATQPTPDERREAEQLGYRIIERSDHFPPKIPAPLYVLGEPELLSHNWIALSPSRNPGEREMQALRAIASELARSGTIEVVALVYGSRVSEDIAQIFLDQGVKTVLLLPFGVLSRKALANQASQESTDLLTLASAAPPSGKWSRQLYSQSMDMLRGNAAVMLLSDPEPDWLMSRGARDWAPTQIFYIRYETTLPSTSEALADAGARPIGRRGFDGTPNIDYMLSAFDASHVGQQGGAGANERNKVVRGAGQSVARVEQERVQDAAEVVTVAWESICEGSRRELLEFLCKLNAVDLSVSFKLLSPLSEIDRQRLNELSQVPSRK